MHPLDHDIKTHDILDEFKDDILNAMGSWIFEKDENNPDSEEPFSDMSPSLKMWFLNVINSVTSIRPNKVYQDSKWYVLEWSEHFSEIMTLSASIEHEDKLICVQKKRREQISEKFEFNAIGAESYFATYSSFNFAKDMLKMQFKNLSREMEHRNQILQLSVNKK